MAEKEDRRTRLTVTHEWSLNPNPQVKPKPELLNPEGSKRVSPQAHQFLLPQSCGAGMEQEHSQWRLKTQTLTPKP